MKKKNDGYEMIQINPLAHRYVMTFSHYLAHQATEEGSKKVSVRDLVSAILLNYEKKRPLPAEAYEAFKLSSKVARKRVKKEQMEKKMLEHGMAIKVGLLGALPPMEDLTPLAPLR